MSIEKVICKNCTMKKYTIFDKDIGNNDPRILEHFDKTSRCCDTPDYIWRFYNKNEIRCFYMSQE